jgi:O-antigen biosynthesis protein WbqV
VLPIWSSQLAEGGPITVTDPRMTRYFMTIHEAAALVIQAAAIEHAPDEPSAPLYVLDMGEPVNILELARRFVLAQGYAVAVDGEPVSLSPESQSSDRPGSDRPMMRITLSGVRPGEKLHEELAYAAELVKPTPFPGINRWGASGYAGPSPALLTLELLAVKPTQDRATVVELLKALVPEMKDPEVVARAEGVSGVLTAGRIAA